VKRPTKKELAEQEARPKPPLICDDCGKPYSIKAPDRCNCGIKMPWLRKDKHGNTPTDTING
jgi:hypothetical protein